jgi:hypothetical protein
MQFFNSKIKDTFSILLNIIFLFLVITKVIFKNKNIKLIIEIIHLKVKDALIVRKMKLFRTKKLILKVKTNLKKKMIQQNYKIIN